MNIEKIINDSVEKTFDELFGEVYPVRFKTWQEAVRYVVKYKMKDWVVVKGGDYYEIH